MLNQLRLAGVFERCEGVAIASWTRCDAAGGKPSLTLEEILRDLVVPGGKPVLAGIEAGHGVTSLTLALGMRHRMDTDSLALEMLESPFEE